MGISIEIFTPLSKLSVVTYGCISCLLQNVMIDALFPKEYFNVKFSTKNGTYHIVKTLQKGDTDLEGALSTIIKQDGSEYNVSPALKQTQFVEIFDPIVVQPELLFFPWDPVKQASHRYQLRVSYYYYSLFSISFLH